MKRLTLLLVVLSGGFFVSSLSAAPRPTAAALIKYFNMQQVPQEGPWFTLTYSSADVLPQSALPARYDGSRAAGSAIIALITRSEFSAMHRLKTDEMWHYYGGDPLKMLVLHPDGHGEVVVLGPDVLGGQKLQYVVPQDSWQGSLPMGNTPDTYSIIGNTLAPAFSYSDFEMGYRGELQQRYPQYREMIAKLTRNEFVTRQPSAASSTPADSVGAHSASAGAQPAAPSSAAEHPATPGATTPATSTTPPTTPTAPPLLFDVDQMKSVQAYLGFQLTEVVGRDAPAHSERCSIAYFSLAAGHSTTTSLNKVAEEYFVIARGTGTVRVGAREVTVAPGSLVVVAPRAEHSLRAAPSNTLYFYAISAPAFSPDDFVAVSTSMNAR